MRDGDDMTNKGSGTEAELTRILTGRPVAPGAEAHLGDDAAICQAARTSYGLPTRGRR